MGLGPSKVPIMAAELRRTSKISVIKKENVLNHSLLKIKFKANQLTEDSIITIIKIKTRSVILTPNPHPSQFAWGSSMSLLSTCSVQSLFKINLPQILVFCSYAEGHRPPTLCPWSHRKLSPKPQVTVRHDKGDQSHRTSICGIESEAQLPGNNECCVFHMIRTVLRHIHPSTPRKCERHQTKVGVSSQPCLVI